MLLENRTAVVYGAAGHVGSAVAAAMAKEGALVHCAGRTLDGVRGVADEIVAAGGRAVAAELDALDEAQVASHLDGVVADAGGIDVTFNAIGPQLECEDEVNPAVAMTVDAFTASMNSRGLAQFVTARAAARHMLEAGSGTVLFLSATPGQGVAPLLVGDAAGFSAVEGMARCLAREWGPAGLRVTCVRSGGMPDSPRIQQVQARMAQFAGVPVEQIAAGAMESTLTGQMQTAAQTADVVTWLASDRATTLAGSIVNASNGAVVH